MKSYLALLFFSVACAPDLLGQIQIRQVTPKAVATPNVPGRYRLMITRSLKMYREVQIMKFTKTDVTFTHESGMETVGLADMPDSIQQTCNYVPAAPAAPAGGMATALDASVLTDQIESVRRTQDRRYLQIVSEDESGVVCQVWGIGGSKDPRVAALRKAGRKLKQYKNEFIYPLHSSDLFSPGFEEAVVKDLKWTDKRETEMVLSLFLVKKGGATSPYIYATSLTTAAKVLQGN